MPAACCGIEFGGTEYGEIKRMYVRPPFRGLGLGVFMPDHLLDFPRQKKVRALRLETGIYQSPAIALYEWYGFRRVPPFGDYKIEPSSRFFELKI